MNYIESGVSSKTREVVLVWIRSKQAMKRAESQAAQARKELDNAINNLGNWICPNDRKKGEVFNIWYGTGLLQVELIDSMENNYSVGWRKEPDEKQRNEEGF